MKERVATMRLDVGECTMTVVSSVVCGETVDFGKLLEATEARQPPVRDDADKRHVDGGSTMPTWQHMATLHLPPLHVSTHQQRQYDRYMVNTEAAVATTTVLDDCASGSPLI